MVWPLGKKRKKVETYEKGKKVEEVPDKVPPLEVPLPPKEEKVETVQLSAEEVFEEGRSVGFQEGMIHSLNHLNAEIVRIQAEIKAHQEAQQKVK